MLDRVPNPSEGHPYAVRFSAPEFTVLCAVTGQPDFAHIMIDYVPKKVVVQTLEVEPIRGLEVALDHAASTAFQISGAVLYLTRSLSSLN